MYRVHGQKNGKSWERRKNLGYLIGQVTISATDVDDTSLTLLQTGAPASLPAPTLASTQNCTAVPNESIVDGSTCTWTMDGQVTDPEALYNIDFTANDGALSSAANPSTTRHALTVMAELATVAFDGTNPVAAQVAEPSGDSGEFTLTVFVVETVPDLPRDGSKDFGDISFAVV